MKKYIFLIIILGSIIPLMSHAAQVDQRCWKKSACIQYRLDTFASDPKQAADGFYSSLEHTDASVACSALPKDEEDPWGFCLPATTAKTEVSFSGNNQFANIGEFIQFIYKYGFMVGSILAVIMIIFAGVQWLFSGGNTDTIGGAKKRIGGAIIGLILLSLSYTILNVINPYLVNFRLPQVWLINTLYVTPNFCKDNSNIQIHEAFKSIEKDQYTDEVKKQQLSKLTAADFTPVSEMNPQPACGMSYYINDGTTNTCGGHFCPPLNNIPRACLPFEIKGAGNGYLKPSPQQVKNYDECWSGELIIDYKVASLSATFYNNITKNLTGPIEESDNGDDDHWLEDQTFQNAPNNKITMVPVCKLSDGTTKIGNHQIVEAIITEINKPAEFNEFIFQFHSVTNAVKNGCKNGTPIGVFIINWININHTSDDAPLILYRSENNYTLTGGGINAKGSIAFPTVLLTIYTDSTLQKKFIPLTGEPQFYSFTLTDSIIKQLE